jgi:hypothetical protein
MKKRLLKPLNRIVIAALVVFTALLAKSVTVVFSKVSLAFPEQKIAPAPSVSTAEPLPQHLDALLFDKLRGRNFFLSALVAAKKNPGSAAAGQAALPPLGANEVRDGETGRTFKYLGTLTFGETPVAFFAGVGPAAKGEPKFFFVPKGKALSKNIRIEDVGEKWVKIVQAGEKTDLNVFFVQIKRLGNEPLPKK